MATKLKGLKVGKVDFVDEGANQRADIKLLKGKNKAEETSDPEIGLFKRFLNWISGEVQKSATTFAEQANIHQDRLFAESYFKAGAWKNELEGVDNTSPSTNQFIKFSNANSDPIAFIDSEKTSMNQQTGRMPNRVGLGINVFNALKVHPGILERVKYGGSTANPASVTENVLAQLFGVEKIVVLKSIMNSAGMGEDENMQYIGDPDAFLLAYATNAPSIDEPSAGYIFTWDMLGNGQMLPILNYLGENGTHTEYVEGLMATDMHKTSDDLARFYKSAV